MYQIHLEGRHEDRYIFIPGTVSDEEWKKRITASEKRYQRFKKQAREVLLMSQKEAANGKRLDHPKEGKKFDQGKQSWFTLPLVILEPLADVCKVGSVQYGMFNMLDPFDNPHERFYDAQMRHTLASQIDPLAIDQELKEKYGVEIYHLSQVAFNALLRLYHCRKEQLWINQTKEEDR